MKITNISIKNYRSCISTAFTPNSELTVLIGPNGSGKTNVLSAIRLLPALMSIRPRHLVSQELPGSASELRVAFDVDGISVIYAAKIQIVTNEKNQDEILTSNESWYMPAVTGRRRRIGVPSSFLADLFQEVSSSHWQGTKRRSHFSEFLLGNGITTEALPILEKIIRHISRISYYSASQFTNPGSSPISFEVEGEDKRRIGISITGHKRFLFDLYQERRSKSKNYDQYAQLVGPDGINLVEAIDFNEIQTSSSNYSVMTGGKVLKKEKTNLLVVPSFKIAGNVLSPSQLSEGTFKTLALILYLVTDRSSILMIEEPEVCVHHGLLSSIIELISIYAKEKQIFISTHSDSVLDKVGIENVFQVRRSKDRGTEVSSIHKRMKARELSALKSYLLNEGSLGEYWKHGDLEND
ncbi:ABC-type lipoprotein export system ATPase subunit [Pelomonas aquatica]|uniref:ABC-type lipoprotein export system ATPase subunit n=1 Tax=Pelomonas aquatica TaxID=431058 RepID=A0ABU1Z6F3_9BURK|nr:AAA family ATPase [Pelomonas aquatica]MDR7296214.1 ABC-type lipoprotein export system ATPase subunit [Pelomonas aquatica]